MCVPNSRSALLLEKVYPIYSLLLDFLRYFERIFLNLFDGGHIVIFQLAKCSVISKDGVLTFVLCFSEASICLHYRS
jgi:hypothetical protein